MNKADPTVQNFEKENAILRHAVGDAQAQLRGAAQQLNKILKDRFMMSETPQEVIDAMDSAAEAISEALRALDASTARKSRMPSSPGAPTQQQGQFLAFIREYMMRNRAGVAPTHAALQQFFNLTPPSVNSMLIRLERRGFIQRIPHRARAIELTIEPDLIPRLDRPFKF